MFTMATCVMVSHTSVFYSLAARARPQNIAVSFLQRGNSNSYLIPRCMYAKSTKNELKIFQFQQRPARDFFNQRLKKKNVRANLDFQISNRARKVSVDNFYLTTVPSYCYGITSEPYVEHLQKNCVTSANKITRLLADFGVGHLNIPYMTYFARSSNFTFAEWRSSWMEQS